MTEGMPSGENILWDRVLSLAAWLEPAGRRDYLLCFPDEATATMTAIKTMIRVQHKMAKMICSRVPRLSILKISPRFMISKSI